MKPLTLSMVMVVVILIIQFVVATALPSDCIAGICFAYKHLAWLLIDANTANNIILKQASD
tara:strand:+ start:1616 stop:1798 length:183 start_codon:yes stop_codon:yes gene_type:complete